MISLSRHRSKVFSHVSFENLYSGWVIVQLTCIELKELQYQDVWSIYVLAYAMTSLWKPITRLSMQVNMLVGTINERTKNSVSNKNDTVIQQELFLSRTHMIERLKL